jgi:hypothetical protein
MGKWRHPDRWWLLAAFALMLGVYWPGLSGGYLFDDYPNIVDNKGIQPHDASLPSLTAAALSSPSSEFKRPLSSLTFAVNYLLTGLDPYWMKLTNLVIHLLNGLLVFLLARLLLASVGAASAATSMDVHSDGVMAEANPATREYREGIAAALITAGWMLLPINLTGVLYVVQRMESLANLFVLLGLIGYVASRRRMLRANASATHNGRGGFALCAISIVFFTAIGATAKETAVMLPLYAFLIEWVLFRFASPANRRDRRLLALFIVVLALPLVVGLLWLVPQVTNPGYWSTRDFTLGTRLLSETRIVVDYIVWTLFPTPHALSFYHDNFPISTGLLTPWTTLASMLALAALVALVLWLRKRRPLISLGIALFLGCQLLTGTILPLELVYEHRNYFASFGLMLALVPWLTGLFPEDTSFALPRRVLLGGLLILWASETAMTASAWGNPLTLAEILAARAPDSPRAQYELGRTYIIYSHYDPASPFTHMAYAPLERAASLPHASILPEQALVYMNARMHLPIKDVWWDSMITKLKARKTGVQDESSLSALTECARKALCSLPEQRMVDAFLAALSHPTPSARLLATYGDYAWNVLDDHALGLRMIQAAIAAAPREPAYRITAVRMLAALGQKGTAWNEFQQLEKLNIGGDLNKTMQNLRPLLGPVAGSKPE